MSFAPASARTHGLAAHGIKSVAADGFGAPGVVVSYTGDAGMQNGSKFAAAGMQIAAGVPLRCDEPADFQTFRLGLFGLDKLHDVDAAVLVVRDEAHALRVSERRQRALGRGLARITNDEDVHRNRKRAPPREGRRSLIVGR